MRVSTAPRPFSSRWGRGVVTYQSSQFRVGFGSVKPDATCKAARVVESPSRWRRQRNLISGKIAIMQISVKLDVSQLVQRLDVAAAEAIKGLRSAVDKAARTARREALKEAARDAGLSVREMSKGQPLVRASTQSNLSASWSIVPVFTNMMRADTAVYARGEGLHASIYKLTGGKSSALSVPKAFSFPVSNSDMPLVFRRILHGPGTHRKGIKSISGEMVRTAMSQEDGAARKVWKRVAERDLKALATVAVERALEGARASTDGGED
jgi:hypothetical protein